MVAYQVGIRTDDYRAVELLGEYVFEQIDGD